MVTSRIEESWLLFHAPVNKPCFEAVRNEEEGFARSMHAIIHPVWPPPIGTHKSALLKRLYKRHLSSAKKALPRTLSSLDPSLRRTLSRFPFLSPSWTLFLYQSTNPLAFSGDRPLDCLVVDPSTLLGFSLLCYISDPLTDDGPLGVVQDGMRLQQVPI